MDRSGIKSNPESLLKIRMKDKDFRFRKQGNHMRDFLDCIKSRKQPVCDMEIGFYSSLPVLLAVMSIRQGRSFTWDGTAAKAV